MLACRLPPMPTAAQGPNRLAPEAPVSQASSFFIHVIEKSPMKFSMHRRLDALAHRRGGIRVDRVDIGAVPPRASPRPLPLQQPAGEALSAKMLRNVEERPRRASRSGIADESASTFPTVPDRDSARAVGRPEISLLWARIASRIASRASRERYRESEVGTGARLWKRRRSGGGWHPNCDDMVS